MRRVFRDEYDGSAGAGPDLEKDPEDLISELVPNDNEAAQVAAKERDDARVARRRAVEKKAEAMIEKELDQ